MTWFEWIFVGLMVWIVLAVIFAALWAYFYPKVGHGR